MTIRHKLTSKQFEVTIPHWEHEYVAKGIDSQYIIEKVDRIYKLYLVDGKKYLGKYEFAHARRLMSKDTRKYYYEESSLVEEPPLESNQALNEKPAIKIQPQNAITRISKKNFIAIKKGTLHIIKLKTGDSFWLWIVRASIVTIIGILVTKYIDSHLPK